jgi:HlyD family secretion protein
VYAGETATAGAPLITVVDISSVVARAHIPQQQAALVKVGDAASITAPGMEKPVPGVVTVVSPATDPGSTTIEIWVKAANPERQLRAGTTVGVSITAQHVPEAVVIPASALLQAPDGKDSVMTVGADHKAHEQTVTVGIRQATEAQILSGLRAGERVITGGAYGLPDGTQVREQSSDPGNAVTHP